MDFNTVYDEEDLKLMGPREQMYFRYRKIQQNNSKPEVQLKIQNMKTSLTHSGVKSPLLRNIANAFMNHGSSKNLNSQTQTSASTKRKARSLYKRARSWSKKLTSVKLENNIENYKSSLEKTRNDEI